MAIEVNILTQPTIQASIKTFVAASEDYQNGYSDGYDKGKSDGEKQGAQTEYDRFWDAVTRNGTRTIYRYAFAGASWNAETFTLNRPIRVGAGVTTAQGMFFAFNSATKSGELPEAVDFTKFSKLIHCCFVRRFW